MRVLALAALLACTSGCATGPAATESEDRLTVGQATSVPNQVRDLHGEYQQALCARLPADCAEKWLAPFSDVVEELRSAGFEASVLRVSGRAGTEQNAALLADEFNALSRAAQGTRDSKRLIVFACSKGLPAVLDLLLRQPGSRSQIAAVVS